MPLQAIFLDFPEMLKFKNFEIKSTCSVLGPNSLPVQCSVLGPNTSQLSTSCHGEIKLSLLFGSIWFNPFLSLTSSGHNSTHKRFWDCPMHFLLANFLEITI